MQDKTQKEKPSNFTFHVKLGDCEVSISGTRDEVLKTIANLPKLVTNVHKAFETAKPKTVATLTVKTEAAKQETKTQNYPRIMTAGNCDEAVMKILGTDWGKWRPRTVEELKEAFRANGLSFSSRVLAGVLAELVKQGTIRRWNTDAGFVYILAEKETLGVRREAE